MHQCYNTRAVVENSLREGPWRTGEIQKKQKKKVNYSFKTVTKAMKLCFILLRFHFIEKQSVQIKFCLINTRRHTVQLRKHEQFKLDSSPSLETWGVRNQMNRESNSECRAGAGAQSCAQCSHSAKQNAVIWDAIKWDILLTCFLWTRVYQLYTWKKE